MDRILDDACSYMLWVSRIRAACDDQLATVSEDDTTEATSGGPLMNLHATLGRGRRVYRSPGTLRAALLVTLAVPVFIVLAFVVKGGAVVGLVLVALLAIFAWRCWQWGISVSAHGVRVVQLFVTRTFQWDEIENFYVAPLSNYPFAAYVSLRNGRKMPSAGISTAQPASDAHRRQVQGPVDELNAMLAEWRKTRNT